MTNASTEYGEQDCGRPSREGKSTNWKMWTLATLVLLILPLGTCGFLIWWYPRWLEDSACIGRGFMTEPPIPHSDALSDLRASDPQFTPRWAPDGSRIAFTTGRRAYSDPPSSEVYVSAAGGFSLQLVADGTSEAYYRIAHSPSFSPDGSQIAYSTLHDSDYEESDFGTGRYAIEVSTLDGSKRQRLTDSDAIDFSPRWAPDGTRIAFVRLHDRDGCDEFRRIELRTTRDDGKDDRRIVDLTTLKGSPGIVWREAWYDSVPAWSPNGRSLAFVIRGTERVVDEGEIEQSDRFYLGDHTALYTVNPDGSDLTRLIAFTESGYAVTSNREMMRTALDSEGPKPSIVSAPAWSPDGLWIAFLAASGSVPTLYTINRDGSNLKELVRLDSRDVGGAGPVGKSQGLFWTRDNWQIMFSWGRTLHIVNADGSDLRSAEVGDYFSPSPDGSRIAHFTDDGSNVVLYTTAPDGWSVSDLARRGEGRQLEAVGPEQRPYADLDSCSAGVVVPEPAKNTGLVSDCQALLKATGKSTITELNWTEDTPITDWEGVTVGDPSNWPESSESVTPSSPPRLLEVSISGHGLKDRILSEFSRLTELRTLSLTDTDLYGPIPRELSQLGKLQRLRLGGGRLQGPIPPELGGLSNLQELELMFSDRSSGSRVTIPRELGGLSSLEVLSLSGRTVSGPIPSELGKLTALRVLDLSYTDIRGPLPPEFGSLSALEILDLTYSIIGGAIPPELEDLPSLEKVNLDGVYGLSGCLPYSWKGKVDREPPGMSYCH